MQDNQPQVSDKDNKIIIDTFTDNEQLLKAMRKIAYGLDMQDSERELLKAAFANEQLHDVIRRRFLPRLSDEQPIGQVGYEWASVQQMVFGQTPDTIKQAVGYKQFSIDKTAQALELFKDPFSGDIELKFEVSEDDPLQINLIGASQYIDHIEKQLVFLYVLAQNGTKSPEEITKKIQKDSSE